MKEESIAFQTIPVEDQNRFENRMSFLYLEYSKVVQSEHGVVALSNDDGELRRTEIQLPVAGLALLCLGPGTSITQAAITSCARSGCVVQFTGGGGHPAYSTITGLTASSRWAQAQALVVSDNALAKKVAKRFYAKQFGVDIGGSSIAQMRGFEGQLVRRLYSEQSNKHGLRKFWRDTKSEDNVNMALNLSNGILYGLAASLTQAIGMNPALGVIHRGNVKSLLFDIADLYKPSISIPISFKLHDADTELLPRLVRSAMRKEIDRRKVMKDMSKFITSAFNPYLPHREDERLIGNGVNDEVAGHSNYADRNEELVL